MSKGTIEIPIEVWECCQDDILEKVRTYKECLKLILKNRKLTKQVKELKNKLKQLKK